MSNIDNGKGVILFILIKDHFLDDNDEMLDGLIKTLNKTKKQP